MNQDQNNFLPLPGDSHLERPIAPDLPGEAQLTHDLQAMYDLEKNASIERVWTRLVRQRTGTNRDVIESQLPEVMNLQKHRHGPERNSRMQQKILPSTPQKSLPHFFSLLAAVLICIALVGSLSLVLNATRNKPPITPVGSHPSGKVKTPTVSSECDDTQDQDEEKLCLEHAEKILNITKTFGTHKVTFVRAYADTTQLLLVYTTTDPATSDVISFTSLTIQQKMQLTGGSSESFIDPKTHQAYYVIFFDTQSVPSGTTDLHVQSVVDAFSGKDTLLNFTLPLHANQKTVSVNKTETSKGLSLTL